MLIHQDTKARQNPNANLIAALIIEGMENCQTPFEISDQILTALRIDRTNSTPPEAFTN